jgi:hypothetical protein
MFSWDRAVAGDPLISVAELPQDLSPWGMFLHADQIVKAVMIGLAVASLVTWTVWVAKRRRAFWRARCSSAWAAHTRQFHNTRPGA